MVWQPDYVTLAEAKSFVRIADVDDDVQIALAITAASRSIDLAANRQFGLLAAVEARFYTAEWDKISRRWIIDIDDLMTQVGLLIAFDSNDDQTYSGVVDNFALLLGNAAANSRPWTRVVVRPNSTTIPTALENGVRVTAKFGWTTIPTPIKQATLLQASRLLSRRDSPFGIAGSPEMGSELRLLEKVDPDVSVAIAPYRRWWAVA